MKRRRFIQASLAVGASSVAAMRVPVSLAAGTPEYRGKLLVSVQASGGWDPTCFCDPKTNTPGEPIINHWAENDEVHWAGNLPYAPFADNQAFFEKYHGRMLVINGIDMQTNSHDIGNVHNWTGRSSESFPTLSAVHAAHHAPDAGLPCMSFGAYSRGGEILSVVSLGSGGASARRQLAAIVEPAQNGYLHERDWEAIQHRHRETMARLRAGNDLVPAARRTIAAYASAFDGGGGLAVFAAKLRELGTSDPWHGAIAAFASGVSASADLAGGDFDTHADNDGRQSQALSWLTGKVDALWELAEEHGLADRLVMVIGSEFSRTNYYNADDGKDHWPIGSLIVMEKNQPWTDRVVNVSDELHFARTVHPRTLEPDDRNGTIIYPKHVHKALRRYLDLERSAGARLYPFREVEDLAFFG